MLYIVHIDESGTHQGSHAMILSGHVATMEKWQKFDQQWREHLKREGLTHHHAVDAAHGTKEYVGWNADRMRQYVERTEKIISSHVLFGFVIRVTEADYRQWYVAERPKGHPLDTKYSLCFRICVLHIVERLVRSRPQEVLEIHFVQESGAAGSADCSRVYNELKKLIKKEYASILGPRTVADKKAIYGLQAADNLAYSAYHVELGSPDLIDMQGGATLEDAQRLVGGKEPVIHRIDVNEKVLTEARATVENYLRHKEERRANSKASASNGLPLPPRLI